MTTRSQIDLSANKSGASRSKGAFLSSFSSLIVALLLVASATLFAGSAQAATGQETDARNGALANAPIDMVAADANDAKSEPEGAVAVYASLPSDTVASEDLTSLFYYSDSLFANPASSYNDVLAYASANLAASSFNSNTGGADYTQKAKNVERLLKDIGCSDIAVNDGFKYKPCEKSNIGVAIGNKKISVNGQHYRLFVIGVRGGGYEGEWTANVLTGASGDHEGFQQARDATITFVMDYIASHVGKGERVKVWASGYSRGGITANMACSWIDKWICERNGTVVPYNGSYNAEHSVYGANYNSAAMRFTEKVFYDPKTFIDGSVSFNQEDVYCYPVNPPQGADGVDVAASKSMTVGIHNIVNPDDWIAQVAPNWDGWSFGRYGTDHDLTCTYAVDRSAAMGDSFANREKSILQENEQGVNNALKRLKKLNPSAAYDSPQFRQQHFSLSAISIATDDEGKGNVYISKGVEMKYNQGRYFGEFFRFICDAGSFANRGVYASELQDDLAYLIDLAMSAPLDVRNKLTSTAMKQAMAAIGKETGYDLNTTMGKIMVAANLDKWMADGSEGAAAVPEKLLKTTITSTLDELQIPYDQGRIDTISSKLAKLVKGVYKKEQATEKFGFCHLCTIIKAASGIAQAHWPEVSLAWWPDPQKDFVVNVTSAMPGAGVLSGEGMYATGATATLKAQAASEEFEFAGWFENGSQVSEASEWSFAVNADRQIEARWLKKGGPENIKTVAFDSNGGVGVMALQEAEKGAAVQLAPNVFTRDGFVFASWNTKPDGTGTSYQDGAQLVMPDEDVVLYAQWVDDGTTHWASLRVEGGLLPESIVRRTGDTFGPLPSVKERLEPGMRIVDWTARDTEGAAIPGGEHITDSSIVSADFPTDITLVANVDMLPSRTVRFYADLDDTQEPVGDPLFKVTVYEGNKARISDDPATMDDGVTHYTAPTRDGYVFLGWATKDDSEGNWKYYSTDATISYKDLDGEVTDLFALWAEEGPDLAKLEGAATEAGFEDLDVGAWYMDASKGGFEGTKTLYVDYVVGRKIMSGYDGTKLFGPDDRVSRAMAATVVYRMATGRTADTTDNNVETPFSDVPKGQWYSAAVAWCAANNIVTGYTGTGRFGPDDDVTREQLATMIFRCCVEACGRQPEKGDISVFSDVAKIAEWACDGVSHCVACGIVSGYSDGSNRFGPQDTATRCQMGKIIAVTDHMLYNIEG